MPRQKSDHVDSASALAARLREARNRAGLSQRRLALGICTPAYVSRLEKGERIPSLQLLRRLAERLGADADELASGMPLRAVDPLLDAELALRLDEVEVAEKGFRDALEVPDPRSRARAEAGLGQLAFRRGDHREAVTRLERAAAGPLTRIGRIAVADSLGRSYAMLGRLDDARGLFERELDAARERQDPVEQIRFGVLLANTEIDAGRFEAASALLDEAVKLADDSRDPIARARLWWSQSRLFSAQEDPETAAQYARLALKTLEASEHTAYAARAHQLLAHVEVDRGNPEEALALLERGSADRAERQPLRDGRVQARAGTRAGSSGGARRGRRARPRVVRMLKDASPTDAGPRVRARRRPLRGLGQRTRDRGLRLAAEVLPVDDRYRIEVTTRLAELLQANRPSRKRSSCSRRTVRAQPAR
jgi:transcriptional regulator with XRE-family HTH domain